MRHRLLGYAAAVLDSAGDDLAQVARDLAWFTTTIHDDEGLRRALTDPNLAAATRRAVVEDILDQRALPGTARLVGFAVSVERAPDLPGVMAGLTALAEGRAQEPSDGEAATSEPPAGGHPATREQLDGYATAQFEELSERGAIENIEDDLFRFARMVESTASLREALTTGRLPAPTRRAIVADLLGSRAQPATSLVVGYATEVARPRDLVALLDWLVERAASERNRRVARVRSAVELDEGQRDRLAHALSQFTGRQVEVRAVVDESLVGGLVALVGDTVIDASVSHQLDRLRTELLAPE